MPIQRLLETYRPLLHGPDRGDPDLLAWVKATDKLDAHLKCAMELAVGNREFAMARRQLEQTLRELGLPEVDYFLEHLAPSFEKTLNELTG